MRNHQSEGAGNNTVIYGNSMDLTKLYQKRLIIRAKGERPNKKSWRRSCPYQSANNIMFSKPRVMSNGMVYVNSFCPRSGSMGSLGVDGPGEGAREGARLLRADAHGDCGHRAVGGLSPAPSSAHRIERTGETSRELVALPRSDIIRICRGSLSGVDGVDTCNLRPRASSSAVAIEEGDTSVTGFGASGASLSEPAAGVVEVDIPIGTCNGRREW